MKSFKLYTEFSWLEVQGYVRPNNLPDKVVGHTKVTGHTKEDAKAKYEALNLGITVTNVEPWSNTKVTPHKLTKVGKEMIMLDVASDIGGTIENFKRMGIKFEFTESECYFLENKTMVETGTVTIRISTVELEKYTYQFTLATLETKLVKYIMDSL